MRKLRASTYPNQVERAVRYIVVRRGGPVKYSEISAEVERLFTVGRTDEIRDPIKSLIDQGLLERVDREGVEAYSVR